MESISCPTCGTRLAVTATRCLVCGTTIEKQPRLPEISFFALVMYVTVVGRAAKINFKPVSGNTVCVRGELNKLESVFLSKDGCLRIDAGNYDGELTVEIPAGTEHIHIP